MSEIIQVIKQAYPLAKLSCPKCCSSDVDVVGHTGYVSASNPLAEKIMRIACKNCEEKDEYIAQQMTDGVKSWLVETKRMYTCTFSFRGEYCATGSYDGIGEFTDGFLVDKDCKLTKGSDCVYWIPPGKIEDIEIEEITVRLSEK